ncbi:MAG: AEC family transporter [Desulfobacterales bacterium]|nr:AEC family transporter [Desulfobacterales bacterium]
MGTPSILTSLLPVFFIIICGYILKKSNFPGDKFWPGAERIVYYILFPALLFSSSAGASWEYYSVASMVWAILATMFVMSGLLLLLRPRLTKKDASFTSIFQGSIRFTSYIGLAAAFSLFGDEGLYLAAVLITVLIPLVNVLSVMVLVRYGGQKGGWYWIFTTVIKNPLIIACLAGMLVNLLGWQLPAIVENMTTILGRGSLPLGLLAVGSSLDFSSIKKTGLEIVYACLLKLILLPLLMWLTCTLLGVDNLSTAIAVLFAALPGSPLSYVLAKQLGGDTKLMSSIIAVQTGVSMISLPVIIALVT